MNKSKTAILSIHDEPQIRRFLRAGFELEGFTVREARMRPSGSNRRRSINRTSSFSISGCPILMFRGVRTMRAWSSVPIIVLSVEADEMQKVRLLRMGADDYVVKPFGMAELLARTDAALRRYFRGVTKGIGRARRRFIHRPSHPNPRSVARVSSSRARNIGCCMCSRPTPPPRGHASAVAQGHLGFEPDP